MYLFYENNVRSKASASFVRIDFGNPGRSESFIHMNFSISMLELKRTCYFKFSPSPHPLPSNSFVVDIFRPSLAHHPTHPRLTVLLLTFSDQNIVASSLRLFILLPMKWCVILSCLIIQPLANTLGELCSVIDACLCISICTVRFNRTNMRNYTCSLPEPNFVTFFDSSHNYLTFMY